MELRALVWAAGRDGALTCGFLADAGFDACTCNSWEQVEVEIERGGGVLIVAGEVLNRSVGEAVQILLARQPAWSDLPVIVVAGREQGGGGFLQLFEYLGNVSVLHRPLSLDTLCSTVRTALRARRRQYQVRDLLQQREEAERRREEFLAMLAHELRNPLAPIRTGLEVLRLTESRETIARTQAMIERQIANLSRLIDDLLDVSRITRGKILLKKQPLDVAEAIRQAVEGHARPASEKGLDLQVDIAPSAESLLVEADPTRFEQMIGNLLTNAIKFTPIRGRIVVSAVGVRGGVEIRVKDSGIGIPAHMLTRVFELFAQTDRPLDRSQGGLGIGLTVVRSLAELHGGSVQAFSEGDGKGTEILIRMPAVSCRELSRSIQSRAVIGEEHGSRRVLVVEDNRDAADLLAAYLRACGHTVYIAYDGLAGISAAIRSQPDVVICDIGLPGVDGYEFARAVRAEPRLQRCILIAVTGYGAVRDRERGFEAGFQHYFTKPADPGEIARLLERGAMQSASQRSSRHV